MFEPETADANDCLGLPMSSYIYYRLLQQLLAKDKLSLDLLKPLIEETVNKIKENKPSKVQTGPAARNDKKTMDAHLKLLSKEKNLQKIYALISKSISPLRSK